MEMKSRKMEQNVLVVDNHPEIRKLMMEILRKKGYQVSTASDGHDALTQFALDRPDLVITSLAVPGLNGYQLCRLIRGISWVPVLAPSSAMASDASIRYIASSQNSRGVVRPGVCRRMSSSR